MIHTDNINLQGYGQTMEVKDNRKGNKTKDIQCQSEGSHALCVQDLDDLQHDDGQAASFCQETLTKNC